MSKIEIKYEAAPGTQVDGGYFVPDIYVSIRRKGFIGWLLRLVGSRRGYQDVKMYKSLLSERVVAGRAVHIPRGTVLIETSDDETFEFVADSELLRKFLTEWAEAE